MFIFACMGIIVQWSPLWLVRDLFAPLYMVGSIVILFNIGEIVSNFLGSKLIKRFNEKTVITYTGLRKGDKVRIPGEHISNIISKLWKLDLFSDINFYLTNIDGEKASIEIVIEELQNIDRKVIEYSHSAGFISYRIGLADYYKNIGISLNPEKEIMVKANIFSFCL